MLPVGLSAVMPGGVESVGVEISLSHLRSKGIGGEFVGWYMVDRKNLEMIRPGLSPHF